MTCINLHFRYTGRTQHTLGMVHTLLNVMSRHTEAADVSVHSDVVQVVLCCLHFTLVALSRVVHCKDRLLAESGVVVEVDLCVETDDWK